MPERSIIDILLRAKGGRQVEVESRKAAGGLGHVADAADRTNRELRKTDRQTHRTRTGLLGLTPATVGAGAAFYGLYRGARTSLEAFMESERTQRMTASALRSTGNQADVTARQLSSMATGLSLLSGMDDEAVQQGENLLLTFRNVRNEAGKGRDIFSQTSRAAVDMAAFFTASGKPMDAQSAFLALGKAMNDPVKGLTRLTRQGVSFDEQQVKQIKTLQKQGDTVGAQRVILSELNKEFGGAAKTMGRTTEGQFNRLHVALGNIGEDIGGMLAPALTKDVLPALTDVGIAIDGIAKRKDLDLAEKITLSERVARERLTPLASAFTGALRDAHLDDKLQHAVEWAAPKIAEGFAHSAPRAATAFLHGFTNMDLPARLLTGALLWTKFRPVFRSMGKMSGRTMGRVFGAAFLLALPDLGKQIAHLVRGPLEDLASQDNLLGSAARTILGYDPRDVVHGGPGGNAKGLNIPGLHNKPPGTYTIIPPSPDPLAPGRKRHPIGQGPPSRGRLTQRPPRGFDPDHSARTKPRLARTGALVAEADVPVQVNVDGKAIAEANARVVVRRKARR